MIFSSSPNFDARRASELVKQYFDGMHTPTGALSFKIEDVKQNSEKDVWIVKCSFFVSLNSQNRTIYEVKVNVKTGKFTSIKEV